MRLSDPGPQAALSAWRRDPAPVQRACADNVWFEERVGPTRLRAFQQAVSDMGVAALSDLGRCHATYVKTFIEVTDVPHSFDGAMEPADIGAKLSDDDCLIRLERLDRRLAAKPLLFDELRQALDNGRTQVIDEFLAYWNGKRDYRPMFAAWRRDVAEELAAEDWAERLRNRLGLAHYRPDDGPIQVALMEYTVREVRAEAGQAAAAFTAPTALDMRPSSQFFPTPRELPHGCAMALAPVYSEAHILAEMIHTRLTYKAHHMKRLGLITAGFQEHDLKTLRNEHLTALRLRSERYDFGEEIT
jgi:hypothetical protein